MKKVTLALILILAVSTFTGLFSQEARLLRQPHISGDKIVFAYAGDIYTVAVTGGTATKMTSFAGFEVFPKFSPDGKWIAFSGQYNGSRQIYVMPSQGGVPKQVTFYPDVGNMAPRGGWDNLPYDWTPDGKKIFVRMNRTPHGQQIGKYFLIDPFQESLEKPLQIPEGGPATLSPDGKKVAYSIKSREFRTWKRYKAGFAQDIFIYDLGSNSVEKITNYEGTDNFPMWTGNSIYFNSDREDVNSGNPRTLNLFCYDITTKKIRQVTNFSNYDVMRPSRGGDKIVFENGGFLYTLDTKTDKAVKVTINLFDDQPYTRPVFKDGSKSIDSYYVSPSGKRAVFAVRGDLFTVPAKHGDTKNITQSESIREISVDWSPDGSYISYLSEKSGDYELYIQKYNSSQKPVQLTKNTNSWINGYIWSYDSKKIILTDKKNRLRMVDVDSKDITQIDKGNYGGISGYRWSPDNKWVVYTKSGENGLSSIWLYSLDNKKTYQMTSDRSSESSPVFAADGKTLSFVSRRNFNFQNRNFDAKLYIGNLLAETASPFAYRNDDEKVAEKSDKNENQDKKTDAKKPDKKKELTVKIDFEGFEDRVLTYPLPTGRYFALTPVKGGLVYIRAGTMYKFDMEKREEKKIMERVRNYFPTADGKKFIYQSGQNYGIAPLSPDQKPNTGKLSLSNMKMRIEPKKEWRQIYSDAWRIMRDWFYDPNMHGVDWKKMHDKYLPLVEHVAHRTDLDYILGELIGELNAGHCYVNSGDAITVEQVASGLLGCEFEPDGNFYKIKHIYQGENWDSQLRSPLTEAGIKVQEGEYLIAIDGNIIRTNENPYKYLQNKVNVQVTLLINSKPAEQGAREVKVKPIRSEIALRHYRWLEHNRKIVEELSGGRIGYIYVPNTSFSGFSAFYKGLQSLNHKDGLIIDERYNGGGSIPQPMINDLAQKPLQYWDRRNLPLNSTPRITHEGPKIMLINGRSSSGGDAFPDYFRKMKLGPLMGMTTWGGLIGYSGSPRFVDGGGFAIPQFAYVNTEGEWDVEYYGVKPDIEVFDEPGLIQAGRQPMIEKAVEYILEELKKNPPKKIKKPKGAIRK